jgi:chitosanase
MASPLQRGLDVCLVQLGLSDLGFDILPTAFSGELPFNWIKELQSAKGLLVPGVADGALIALLT